MRHFHSYLAAAALCLFIPSGCSSSSSDEWPSSGNAEWSGENELRISLEKSCLSTECDKKSAQTCSTCMSACWDLNDPYLDCESACRASCSNRDCEGSPCVEAKYQFVVEGPADPVVEDTCLLVATQDQSDGATQAQRRQCHVLAKIYEPSTVIPYWECKLRNGCPGDGSYEPPPQGTVGGEYCKAAKALTTTCRTDLRDGLNEVELYFRPLAVDALRTCFSEASKSQIESCMAAWLSIGS